MQGLEADTIGGFNSVLKEHKKMEGNAVVTTVLFDDKIDVICDRKDIKKVQPISGKEYFVRGCTALLDAVGSTIDNISKVQKNLPKHHRAKNVAFVITTDGFENASKEYSYEKVRRMIEKKQGKGWDFIFMGANIDAVAEAGRLGIAEDHAATYLADSLGTSAVFESMAHATCSLRENDEITGSWSAAVVADRLKRDAESA